MDLQYYVTLNNEYDFKAYCTQKSIEAFEAAIAQEHFPSRFSLVTLLVPELISEFGYLIKKLIETTFHIFHILSVRFKEQKPFSMQGFSKLAGLITIQLCLPFVCTAIRIYATISGLLVPRWAVQGWKLAESGENLSYLLWSKSFQEFGNQHLDISAYLAYEEIAPSDAIFYLGKKQTHLYLDSITDYEELRLEIIAIFAGFLQEIALKDPKCFKELLDFPLGSDADDKNNAQSKKLKNRSYYRSDDEIRKILSKFKDELTEEEEEINIEELDELRLGDILKTLDNKELQKLFYNLYFNLHAAFENNEIKKLNQETTFFYFTELRDLFSLQFNFGRVHFYQSTNSLHCYSPD